jgi:hypothetical protein
MNKEEQRWLKKLNEHSATDCFRAFTKLFEAYYEEEKEKLVHAEDQNLKEIQGSARAYKKLMGIKKRLESLRETKRFDGGYR